MKFIFTASLMVFLLAAMIVEQKVDAQCPLHPSSCSCPDGTTYRRCTGAFCQKCVCGTGRNPGPCLLGNGGGGIWAAVGGIFGIGKKK